MIGSQNLTEEQLQDLKNKGALCLGHFMKKYSRGKAGHWQELKYTKYNLDTKGGVQLLLSGGKNSDEFRAHYYIKSNHLIYLNGRPCYENFIFDQDRLVIDQEIYTFQSFKDKGDGEVLLSEKISLSSAIVHTQLPVLLIGETGTGKGHLAKKIHEQRGGRKPWIHINIAALSPGLIESEIFGHVKGAFTGAINNHVGALKAANGGVLFLDEIDSLPVEIQSKLLIFLDDYKLKSVGSCIEEQVLVKLIVASGQNLEELVRSGKMRRDFYYRLKCGYTLKLPSLAEEPQLIRKFCDQFTKKNKVIMDVSLIEFYCNLPWHGNYRQLKAHLEKKLSLCGKCNYFYKDNVDEALLISKDIGEENIFHV